MAVILLNKKEWTKDGRKWIFYTRYKDLSGKTKQYKSKKFLNKKEAIEAERLFLLQLDKYRPDNDMTFKDLYTAFYEYQQDKVKETTLNTYKDRMRYMGILDNVELVNLNGEDYQRWRNEINKLDIRSTYKRDIQKFIKMVIRINKSRIDNSIKGSYNK